MVLKMQHFHQIYLANNTNIDMGAENICASLWIGHSDFNCEWDWWVLLTDIKVEIVCVESVGSGRAVTINRVAGIVEVWRKLVINSDITCQNGNDSGSQSMMDLWMTEINLHTNDTILTHGATSHIAASNTHCNWAGDAVRAYRNEYSFIL